MQAFAIFYLTISTGLALIVTAGVVAAPRGERVGLATWGGVAAALWFFLLIALFADEAITRCIRLAKRVRGR
ncbi:hypothetical protein [Sphingopyxis sp. FD7]|uniref:hypothetical protein n=1 Tax=Sphingopyxis sp. FD7 TaxID=1914525 RepID=UPI000DC63931|nr:hypothetical protein [Sphingopyxis sp. FD7]BBB13429.1 hydroxymethylglutaryl-synthase [Sphingopyxis sp. FD7]